MTYTFFGYGSLLSHKSLKETIPDRTFIPAIIKDYKRVFNLALKDSTNADVCNLVKSTHSQCNGVLFTLNDDELKKIKEREDDYNLEPVACFDFTAKKKLGLAFTVIDHIVAIDTKNRKPIKSYFVLCREAAHHISPEFGKVWDDTTFLSGGEKVADWIKKNSDWDTIKR